MARIYLKQGYIERAISIYQKLVQDSFADEVLYKEYHAAIAQRRKVIVLLRQWMDFSILYRQMRTLKMYRNRSQF